MRALVAAVALLWVGAQAVWAAQGAGASEVAVANAVLAGRVVASPPAQVMNATGVWQSGWQNSPWETVEAKSVTEAALQLQFFTAGERGGEVQMLHDLRRERVHVADLSLHTLLSVVPELSVVLAPYVFASDDELLFVFENYLRNTISDLLAEKNLLLVQWLDVRPLGIYSAHPLPLADSERQPRLGGVSNLSLIHI